MFSYIGKSLFRFLFSESCFRTKSVSATPLLGFLLLSCPLIFLPLFYLFEFISFAFLYSKRNIDICPKNHANYWTITFPMAFYRYLPEWWYFLLIGIRNLDLKHYVSCFQGYQVTSEVVVQVCHFIFSYFREFRQ